MGVEYVQHAWEFSNNGHDPGRYVTRGDRALRNLKNPRVSVVIPTRNEAKNLPMVMPRLPQGTLRGDHRGRALDRRHPGWPESCAPT